MIRLISSFIIALILSVTGVAGITKNPVDGGLPTGWDRRTQTIICLDTKKRFDEYMSSSNAFLLKKGIADSNNKTWYVYNMPNNKQTYKQIIIEIAPDGAYCFLSTGILTVEKNKKSSAFKEELGKGFTQKIGKGFKIEYGDKPR